MKVSSSLREQQQQQQHLQELLQRDEVEAIPDILCAPTLPSTGGTLTTTTRRRGHHHLLVVSDSDRSVLRLISSSSEHGANSNGDLLLNIHHAPPISPKQRIRRVSASNGGSRAVVNSRRRRSSSILAAIDTNTCDPCTCLGVVVFSLVVLGVFLFVVMSVGSIALYGLNGERRSGGSAIHFDHDHHAFQKYTAGAPPCSDPMDPEQISFTLVTQLSDDRIWMMEHHCYRWGKEAPISVVVFTNLTITNVTQQLVELGCDANQIKVQIVSSDLFPSDDYPVNVLRNKALSVVETTHVMYADIDFWESDDLYHVLMSEETRFALAQDHTLALVVPAFQLNRQCREWMDCRELNIPKMPRSKEILMKQLMTKHISVFYPTNLGGHGSTQYAEWFYQHTNDLIDIPCVRSNRYEPYMAFRYCHSLPPFQEAFSGYGKNKMTWVMHLRWAGYRFQQVSLAFLIHYPHLDSASRMEWNEKPPELEVQTDNQGRRYQKGPTEVEASIDWQQYKRGKVDATFVQFRQWLTNEISNKTRIPRCENAQDDDSRLWIDRHSIAPKDEPDTIATR